MLACPTDAAEVVCEEVLDQLQQGTAAIPFHGSTFLVS
jgi:hypothetical protein